MTKATSNSDLKTEITTAISRKKKLKRVLLSGGGTGGHIYPALAVAEELKQQHPEIDVRFVGSARGLESKIIPPKGYHLYTLSIGPLHSSVGRSQQMKTLVMLPFVVLQCLWILLRFRPQRVIGFGGYASGPIVCMASILFFKTALWEANVQPGIANKILAKLVSLCFVVFEESLKFFPADKTKCFGYPVRAEFDALYLTQKEVQAVAVSAEEKQVSHSMLEPSKENKRYKILVFGGSQGARVFNELIPKMALKFKNIDFTLQTGLKNYDSTVKSLSVPIDNLKIYPFLDPIVDFYLGADLVICRSGAGSLAELSAIGVNALFVPFALASDNHQYKNALALCQRNAAYLIEEKNFNEDVLTKFLNDFQAKSPEEHRQMSQRMLAFFKPRATQNMVSNF